MKSWGSFLLPFLVGVTCDSFINTDVQQNIAADSHILHIDAVITIDLPNVVSEPYMYLVDPENSHRLCFIQSKADSKVVLNVGKPTNVSKFLAYPIDIPKDMTGRLFKFTVSTFFSRAITPKPAVITQSEKQFVEFSSNVAYFSMYPTKQCVSTVICGNGDVVNYSTDVEPVKRIASKVKYGPFTDDQTLLKRIATFNFESGAPFLAVTYLERIVEISHWGNIAVENKVSIFHYGAELQGGFSRLDYQRGIGHHSSVPVIKSVLPASAKDIYYRDEIGNISTSRVKSMFNSVEVELMPRFPLFGGWKTFFILGYNLPAHENLYRKGNRFGLMINFVDYLYEDQLVDDMTLRIILPETVSNIDLKMPFDVDRLPDEVEKTYLDTTGRTVLVIKKKNLVSGHIQDFTVYYDFDMMNIVREPAMLVSAFLLLLTVVIIYVRLDFSLSTDKFSELQQRTHALVDEIVGQQNKRSALYQLCEDVVSTFKATKDLEGFRSQFRKVEADQKIVSLKIASLQTEIRELWSDGADKVEELQRLNQDYHSLLNKGVSLAENVVAGKISKAQYQTEDCSLSAKKVGLIEKMDAICEFL